jgi:hypothetical protein
MGSSDNENGEHLDNENGSKMGDRRTTPTMLLPPLKDTSEPTVETRKTYLNAPNELPIASQAPIVPSRSTQC